MATLTRRAFLKGVGGSTTVGTGAAVGATSLAGCSAPTALSTDWAQYRFDAARTGYTPTVEGPTEATERWVARTTERRVSPLAVVGPRVFVNSDAVAALSVRDGSNVWSRELYYRSSSAPAVADGVVYAGSRFALWALDATNGRQGWQVTLGDRELHATAIADGVVYVVSTASRVPYDATLHALDAGDGSEQWRASVGELTLPSFVPAVADETVYVGKEKLFALDRNDGSERWTVELPGTFGDPAIADGTLYVGSRQTGNSGAVFALDATDGRLRWRFDTGLSAKSLATDGETVYVASDAVYALDASEGIERWRFESNRYVLAAPAVTTERVYIAGLLGTVRALDAASGDEVWLVRTQSTMLSSPAVVSDAVYVGGTQTVYALG